jgi:myo-inositol-1-phosphate synthase
LVAQEVFDNCRTDHQVAKNSYSLSKNALDRGIGGPLAGASAYFMKSPAVQYHDDEARVMVEQFANGE